MGKNKVIIMAAGGTPSEDSFYRLCLESSSYTIAADGGLGFFYRLRQYPDLLVGDFDSVLSAEWKWAQTKPVPIRQFPREKDATDTQLALDIAISRAKETKEDIYILGGIGKRLDHTLANLYLLVYAYEQGANVVLLNPWHEICLLTPREEKRVYGKSGDIVSVIPITQISGLNLRGFHWNLSSRSLKLSTTLGISNYLEEKEGYVSLQNGMAFVMKVKEENI